ncbi:hypothetical protein PUV47_15605 [Pseudovibrio exalbescens]|uniref:hypothetical protein n=1 Tax=Pseudovibrio exalbescens TaxID=197461 RepID=UPI0023658608|nr:hypothetical protein [Pseudovibrio exalbescens]MDD7911356.1 hypothetical protein [Pseudovibrio exalbescens]
MRDFSSREKKESDGMPVQNNASLQIINVNNIGFGTIRLQPQAYVSQFRYNLEFEDGQLPSIYFAANPTVSNYSMRLRPLHEHGFCPTNGGTRMYFAVAGLQMENPRNALSTNLEQVTGSIYKSKYYVFIKLGVSQTDFIAAIAALQTSSTQMSTQELQEANAAKNVTGATRTVYVNEGTLAGTFWAHKHSGWESGLMGSSANKLYRPMELMDFSIQGGDVAQAQGVGDQYANSLNLIPTDSANVHSGHSLIDPEKLRAYYIAQADPAGTGNITGTEIWNNLFRLGQYQQFHSLYANNGQVSRTEIVPGSQTFPLSMFRYYPSYNRNIDTATMSTTQRQYICSLIGGFVNN